MTGVVEMLLDELHGEDRWEMPRDVSLSWRSFRFVFLSEVKHMGVNAC